MKRPDITKVCEHCGQSYTRPDWSIWRASRYCSPACYTEARRALEPHQRAALMTKATDAIRGSKRTHYDLCKRARTKQDRAKLSKDETAILAALHAANLRPIPEYAIDKFNVDFAFPDERLAVEYNGGNWHNTPKKRSEDDAKALYLRANGWNVLVFNSSTNVADMVKHISWTVRLAKERPDDFWIVTKAQQIAHLATRPRQ